ncbi:MAG: glycosyltransferase family 2 protein [Patescibacteria group bacterium]
MKTVAIIPAFNEENRIVDSVNDASAFVDEVVVVDDCSRDRTRERAVSTGAYVLHHIINRGQGASLQTGMDFALKKLGAEILVHFDADGQMRGDEISKLVEPIISGRADVALGSRFLGTTEALPLGRKWTLKAGILFTFLVSGVWLTDTHNGFRALSKLATEKINLTQNRMAHASELIDLIALRRLRVHEVPVTIRYSEESIRKGQRSSASINIALDITRQKFLK